MGLIVSFSVWVCVRHYKIEDGLRKICLLLSAYRGSSNFL